MEVTPQIRTSTGFAAASFASSSKNWHDTEVHRKCTTESDGMLRLIQKSGPALNNGIDQYNDLINLMLKLYIDCTLSTNKMTMINLMLKPLRSSQVQSLDETFLIIIF